MDKKPILQWVQDQKNHSRWYAPHPFAEQNSAPIASIEFITDKPYQQNNWYATILNMFVVPVATGPTIWQPFWAQHEAELILFAHVHDLNEQLDDIHAKALKDIDPIKEAMSS